VAARVTAQAAPAFGGGFARDCAVVRDLFPGAFGAVRLGVHVPSLRLVDVETVAADVKALRVAAKDARAAVGEAPNVCAVIGVKAEGPAAILVSEHLDGGSLRHVCDAGGFAGHEAPLLHVAAQALAGLAAIHAACLVHGGVAPESIRVARDGRVKLAALGAGAAVAPRSAAYAAPDGLKTAAADVFSLGATLYEAATGGPLAKIGEEPELGAPYGKGVAALVLHATRRDSSLRATAPFLLQAPCLAASKAAPWPFPHALIVELGPFLPADAGDELDKVAAAVAAHEAASPQEAFLADVFGK